MANIELKDFYYDNIKFKKTGEEISIGNAKINNNIEVLEGEDNLFEIIISIKCEEKNVYKLSFDTIAIFEINCDEGEIDDYIQSAISIMFPYVRVELTTLTSQPNLKPVILSVIDSSEGME